MVQALIVVDAQNEFSAAGKRPVPNHSSALAAIQHHVDDARRARMPIAWVRHHNKPHESPAFVPGTWGAEFSAGLGPQDGFGHEAVFEKDVYGAFSTTGLETWLRSALLQLAHMGATIVSTNAFPTAARGYGGLSGPSELRKTGWRM